MRETDTSKSQPPTDLDSYVLGRLIVLVWHHTMDTLGTDSSLSCAKREDNSPSPNDSTAGQVSEAMIRGDGVDRNS